MRKQLNITDRNGNLYSANVYDYETQKNGEIIMFYVSDIKRDLRTPMYKKDINKIELKGMYQQMWEKVKKELKENKDAVAYMELLEKEFKNESKN